MTKKLLCRLKESFGPFNMLTVHKCSDRGLFTDLINPAFRSLQFQKEITSEAHVLFQSILSFMKVPITKKKIEKTFLDFEIIAFELVALDTLFY